MRKNTAEVIRAVADRKSLKKCNSVWTDGQHIFSYGTCILAQRRDGRFVLNRTKYSPTTTNHQNAIAAWGMIRAGLGIVSEVDGLYRGASADMVLEVADTLTGANA